MLNHYEKTITFILQMNVLAQANDITVWITDRSAGVTHELNEEKTRRF
jgi:hypothetical protein